MLSQKPEQSADLSIASQIQTFAEPVDDPVIVRVGVCEIFYWRDVNVCFTMTYGVNGFDVFAILLEGKSWKTNLQ